MTFLPNSFNLETKAEKSLSPETMTKVSMYSRSNKIPIASTASLMSVAFLSLLPREGNSINSTPASCISRRYSMCRCQSAYAFFTITLPFSLRRPKIISISKSAMYACLTLATILSQSTNAATFVALVASLISILLTPFLAQISFGAIALLLFN